MLKDAIRNINKKRANRCGVQTFSTYNLEIEMSPWWFKLCMTSVLTWKLCMTSELMEHIGSSGTFDFETYL